jgi:hypothetical protein
VRWASWQASERVARRSKVIPFHGTRIILPPHDPVSSSVLYYGLPDFKEMRFLLAWLSPDDVFIDVGANVGLYSVLAAGVRRASVAAFEPSSETSDRLLENVRLN